MHQGEIRTYIAGSGSEGPRLCLWLVGLTILRCKHLQFEWVNDSLAELNAGSFIHLVF